MQALLKTSMVCSCTELALQDWTLVAPDRAFAVGIRCALGDWQVLNTAVQDGWAGCSRVGLMRVDQLFRSIYSELQISEQREASFLEEEGVEDILFDFMATQFNCQLEDGSVEWVARVISHLFDDCFMKASFDGLATLVSRSRSPRILRDILKGVDNPTDVLGCECEAGSVEAVVNRDESDDSAADDVVKQPEVDDDGWEVVKPKSKTRQRKQHK